MNNAERKATPAEKNKFEAKCYEAYKLHWMIAHGATINEMFDILVDIAAEEVADGIVISSGEEVHRLYRRALSIFETDAGFHGEVWAGLFEFLGAEFLDFGYMQQLFQLMDNGTEMETFYFVNYCGGKENG